MSDEDLIIRYYPYGDTDTITCYCSDWTTSGYSFSIVTWLNKTQLDTLMDHITPGAVDTLFTLMGRPVMYDKTWTSENTLFFLPTGSTSTLKYRRKETGMFVKNISTHPIEGGNRFIETRIEGYISGANTTI